MDGIKIMFNERWFGSMNNLYIVKKLKKIEHEVFMTNKLARYINNKKNYSMCSTREHSVTTLV